MIDILNIKYLIYLSLFNFILSDKITEDCYYIDDCFKEFNVHTSCILNKCIRSTDERYSNKCLDDEKDCMRLCRGKNFKENIHFNNFTKCCECGEIRFKQSWRPRDEDCQNICLNANKSYIVSADNFCHCLDSKYNSFELCADDFKCQRFCENFINSKINGRIDIIGQCENNHCVCQRTLFPKNEELCNDEICFQHAQQKFLANGICDRNNSTCIYSTRPISEYGNFVCNQTKCSKLVNGYIFFRTWNGVCNHETNMCDWVKNSYSYNLT